MLTIEKPTLFSLTTVATSLLFVNQGKALVVNALCVGLLPHAFTCEDFNSKLILVLSGAVLSGTLSACLKGRLSITLRGLACQTVCQIGFSYAFSSSVKRHEDSLKKNHQKPEFINYQTIKKENLETHMEKGVGEKLQQNTVPFDLVMDPLDSKGNCTIIIEVLGLDCLDAAKAAVDKGYKTAVVNFASTQEFGGGFTEGCKGSQEEELCYRSTLGALAEYQLLNPDYKKFSLAITTGTLGDWSSDQPSKVLCTPGVQVFRGSDYSLLQKSYTIGILSCAALVRINRASTPYSEEEKKLMKAIIRTQLHVAKENGYTAFVSGAFGCGRFGNPPREVAELYREVLSSEFSGAFEYVAFAILPDAYDKTKDNFGPFQEVFNSPQNK